MTYETPRLILMDAVSAVVLGGGPGSQDPGNPDFEQLVAGIVPGLE
jgi:hypothetical protein